MIKNIIFDWSGVIKDAINDQLLVVNKIFKNFGISEISLEELKENWEEPYMIFFNKYLPKLTLEQEQATYKKVILDLPRGRCFPGVVEVLKKFKEAEVEMAILSSDLPETVLPEIKEFGLENVFADIVTGMHNKSESLRELINRNNFKIQETIFIGDSRQEIEEGKNAGVKTGAVTWGFYAKERLEALKPDFIINNLEELKLIVS